MQSKVESPQLRACPPGPWLQSSKMVPAIRGGLEPETAAQHVFFLAVIA